MNQWLASEANIEEHENPWNSSDFDTYPGTALITKGWGANNKLNASKLSQFPRGGLEGLFKIVDPNIMIPSFDNASSKEGVLITLILYTHVLLESKWETIFRGYHPQLKDVGIAKLARRLNYIRETAGTSSLANLSPPCSFKHDFLLLAETYNRKAFEAYKGIQFTGASTQVESEQAAKPKDMLETGIDKHG